MSGIYSVSLSEAELEAYATGIAESVPKNAPESDFADPPHGLYVGDPKHVGYAVQAVTSGFRGNKATNRSKPGVKAKVEAAVRKHFKGEDQKYYLTWLRTGHKPVSEMVSIELPPFSFVDEPGYPDVPPALGVDMGALTAGDSDPMFITRPLAVLGSVSDNGLVYDQALIDAIYEQVLAKRPPGRLGHVSEENRSWEFPPDVVLWIGALQDNGTLYGKCYVYPNTEFKTMARKRKAAGSGLSNSIWGQASQVDNADGTRRSIGLKLESIDFVPPERAALEALGGKFAVTSEMEKGQGSMAEGEDRVQATEFWKTGVASLAPEEVEGVLSEAQRHHIAQSHMGSTSCSECSKGMYEMLHSEHRGRIAEAHIKQMSPEEVNKHLSDAQRAHIVESHLMQKSMKMVPSEAKVVEESKLAEMKRDLENQFSAQIAEMGNVIKQYQREDFDRAVTAEIDRRLDWNVHTTDGKQKLAALKANFRVMLVAEMAGSTKKEDISPAADRAWTTFTPLAEMTRAALAGPSAFVGTVTSSPTGGREAQYGFDPKSGQYDDKTAKQQAAKLFGIGG